MIVIWIPTPLRPFTDGQKEVAIPGDTVGAALSELAARYPALRKHLYDEAGGLRPFVNVFRNQEDVRNLQGEQTPLGEGDRLRIVPSIAGGLKGHSLPPAEAWELLLRCGRPSPP